MSRFGYKYIPERNTLTKNAKRSKHFMRTYNGWAIDKETADRYPDVDIEVVDKESDFTYRIVSKKLRDFGETIDYGFGEQYVLDIKHWDVQKSAQPKLI